MFQNQIQVILDCLIETCKNKVEVMVITSKRVISSAINKINNKQQSARK